MASRRAAWLLGAAGVGLAVLATKSHARSWPHETDGVLGDAAALVLALAAGWRALRLRARPWLAAATVVFAYLALSATNPRLLREGPTFGGPAGYFYAPHGCEFAARFPSRPGMGRSEAHGATGLSAVSHRAELAHVGYATQDRAECLAFAGMLDEDARRRVASWTADHLREWARASGGTVEDIAIVERPDGLSLAARYVGRDETNRPLTSWIAGRAAVGEHSMMVLITTRLGGGGPDTAFLGSLARRD